MIATFWQQLPMLRLLIPFACGIVISQDYEAGLANPLILLGLSLLFYFFLNKYSQKLNAETYKGLLLSLAFLALGWATVANFKYKQHHSHFSHHKSNHLLIQPTGKIKMAGRTYRLNALVIATLNQQNAWQNTQGKILLTVIKDSLSHSIEEGATYLIKSQYQECVFPKNPGGFNYQQYLKNQSINHCMLVRQNELIIVNHAQLPFWKTFTQSTVNYINQSLGSYLSDSNQIALAQALIFGEDDYISTEISNYFSSTGTLHVLAVSGMHVGLIFLLLSFILKPIEKLKGANWSLPLLQLVGIWLYSMICGLSPSILRAVIMFSFMIIGKMIQRNGNSLNSLAASALFLLLIYPNLLFHAGFQLSYAAVAGIIAFYKQLYHLVEWRWRFVDEIWKVISVTIAAQVFTAPISLFYFKQFPLYFIPANLLIIPVTTVAIYVGIGLVMASPWPLIATKLSWALSKLILLTIYLAEQLSQLPLATIQFNNFGYYEAILIFLMVGSISLYFTIQFVPALKIFLMILALLPLNSLFTAIKQEKNNLLVLHYQPKDAIIQLIKGSNSLIYTSHANESDKIPIPNTLRQANQFYGVNQFKILPIPQENFILHTQPAFLFSNDGTPLPPNKHYKLVVAGNAYLSLDTLIMLNPPIEVIFMADVRRNKKEALKKICGKHTVPWYDIATAGFYENQLK